MGPYCKYCNRRCFVLRTLPEESGYRTLTGGRELLMATCPKGEEADRRGTGYDHTTAANPYAPPVQVDEPSCTGPCCARDEESRL